MPKHRRINADKLAIKEAKNLLNEREDLNTHLEQAFSDDDPDVLPQVQLTPLPIAPVMRTAPLTFKAPLPKPASLSSNLFCEEILSESPPLSPIKPVLLSPYSKAKVRAENAGVKLPLNWRDPYWYTPEELDKRIKAVEEYNNFQKEQELKGGLAAKKRLFN